MKQMQTTLTKKGEHNQRLSETVNMIKNQILSEQIFDERYSVQQSNALTTTNYTVSVFPRNFINIFVNKEQFGYVRDRAETGEFFLEIASTGQN